MANHCFALSEDFKDDFKNHLNELTHINNSDDYFKKILQGKVDISIGRTDSGYLMSDTVQILLKPKGGSFAVTYSCELYKADLALKRECGVLKLNGCEFMASPSNRAANTDFKLHFGHIDKLTRSSEHFYYIQNRDKLESCKSSTLGRSISDSSRDNQWKDGLPPGVTRSRSSSVKQD